MRITVVGAILIVATVVAGVFLLLVLNGNQNGSTKQPTGDIQADQLLQYGTDV
jgi:hypothetical protein